MLFTTALLKNGLGKRVVLAPLDPPMLFITLAVFHWIPHVGTCFWWTCDVSYCNRKAIRLKKCPLTFSTCCYLPDGHNVTPANTAISRRHIGHWDSFNFPACYHPCMRVGNVFGHVCLCVCLSVCLCFCLFRL